MVHNGSMKISTKGRYALRVMIDIAQHGHHDQTVAVKDIADRQGISKKYLEQIMTLLSKADLITTTRGNVGGYKLTRQPDTYSVGEILRATEGDLTPLACLNDDSYCPRQENCPTQAFWQGLHQTITTYVDRQTLADLLR